MQFSKRFDFTKRSVQSQDLRLSRRGKTVELNSEAILISLITSLFGISDKTEDSKNRIFQNCTENRDGFMTEKLICFFNCLKALVTMVYCNVYHWLPIMTIGVTKTLVNKLGANSMSNSDVKHEEKIRNNKAENKVD